MKQLIGESTILKETISLAETYAITRHPIVIMGETGTGKQLLAEHIHRLSGVSGGKLVELNCAGIPEALLESELFGTEPHAFTGAKSTSKPGFLELADRGTLFLDEIGEMPLSIQAKLLRALDHSFYHVGGHRPITTKARIIAATNADLRAAKGKTFREDLYYRLMVLELIMPPLREREEDIPLLIDSFCRRENFEFDSHGDADSVRQWNAYPWPGNVRELKNVVMRALTMAKGKRISSLQVIEALRGSIRQDIVKMPEMKQGAESIPFKNKDHIIPWSTFQEAYLKAVWEALPVKSVEAFSEAVGFHRRTAARWNRKLHLWKAISGPNK